MSNNFTGLFTSESVSEGHPDKLCDQVSDAVLDAILEQDPQDTTQIHIGGRIIRMVGQVFDHCQRKVAF